MGEGYGKAVVLAGITIFLICVAFGLFIGKYFWGSYKKGWWIVGALVTIAIVYIGFGEKISHVLFPQNFVPTKPLNPIEMDKANAI